MGIGPFRSMAVGVLVPHDVIGVEAPRSHEFIRHFEDVAPTVAADRTGEGGLAALVFQVFHGCLLMDDEAALVGPVIFDGRQVGLCPRCQRQGDDDDGAHEGDDDGSDHLVMMVRCMARSKMARKGAVIWGSLRLRGLDVRGPTPLAPPMPGRRPPLGRL